MLAPKYSNWHRNIWCDINLKRQNSQICPELSWPAQFRHSTIKMSNLVPEQSILVRFHPCAEMACHHGLTCQRIVRLAFQLTLKYQFYPCSFFSRHLPLSLPGSQTAACCGECGAAPRHPSPNLLAGPLLACSPPSASPILTTIPSICSSSSCSNCKINRQNGTFSSQIEPSCPQFQSNHKP